MESTKQHTIDFLFVLGLFVVFTMSALAVVYIGSRVYANTEKTMEISQNNHTAMNYIVEKVRANNESAGIAIKKINNQQVLCLYETAQKKTYVTYVYCYQGKLRELYVSDTQSFDPESGDVIMNATDLSFKAEDTILTITLTMNGTTETSQVHVLGGVRNAS